MSKYRKPPANKSSREFGAPDNSRALTGEIPWSAIELQEALAFAARMHHTPHDDWDRKERGVSIRHEDESVSRIVFNPDKPLNQLMHHVTERLREAKQPVEVVFSHCWRVMQILDFMMDHDARLRSEGFVVDDPTDPACHMVSEELLAALATAQYGGVRLQGSDRDPVRTFHIEEVVALARSPGDSDGGGSV